MGQRLQAYIHTWNPARLMRENYKAQGKKYWKGNVEEQKGVLEKIEKFELAFGKGKTTVLAFHHQWLYGRSALLAASNVLEFIRCSNQDNNLFSYKINQEAESLPTTVKTILSMFTNKLAFAIGRFGIEHFHLLNFTEAEIRHDFTLGDNNDGIFIIDTIGHKYCFMNIGTGDSTISKLPVMTPQTANEYVMAYYPECLTDTVMNDSSDINKMECEVIQNKRMNKLFLRSFQNVGLLSEVELVKIFPKVYIKENDSDRSEICGKR